MSETILELKNIHKSFGKNAVHRGINITLKKGESLGLLGGSGTGKSVLLRSIIGLERIDQGEILFHGKRFDHLNEDQLTPYRIKISYSFQSGALFDSVNVFENIAYPLFEHTRLAIVRSKTRWAKCSNLSIFQAERKSCLRIFRVVCKSVLEWRER